MNPITPTVSVMSPASGIAEAVKLVALFPGLLIVGTQSTFMGMPSMTAGIVVSAVVWGSLFLLLSGSKR